MTAHQLATLLLAGPDLPVVINGWGSSEGTIYEVSGAEQGNASFNGEGDSSETPRDNMGWIVPRPCISLDQCDPTPRSAKQVADAAASRAKIEEDRARLGPVAFKMVYTEIEPLTPDEVVRMAEKEGLTFTNEQRNDAP